MPYLSQTDLREKQQSIKPFEKRSTFSDTFGASLGMTIDEDLSISGALNREGWDSRRQQVRTLIDNGEIDRDRYTDRRGRFDYNRLASEREDVKGDEQLNEERREVLARRRKYAESVIEKGNGLAQFLGAANAFVLDPISIATIPIATAATGAKSLSVAARALLTARNTAVIEGAAEIGIQGFVYEHKQDIDSPYTEIDAIKNIAAAAVGAGAIGGVTGGISGYLSKVKELGEGIEKTPEVQQAFDQIERLERTLEGIEPEKQVDFLNELEAQRKVTGAPTRTQEQYAEIEPDFEPAQTVGRQSEILERTGTKQDFDLAMDEFSRLDAPMVIEGDELIDGKAFMKTIDEDMDGLESVLVCTRG